MENHKGVNPKGFGLPCKSKNKKIQKKKKIGLRVLFDYEKC